MANECGFMERVECEGRPVVFHGEFEGLYIPNMGNEFYLIPSDKRTDKSPDYSVKLMSPSGQYVAYGNAWLKKMQAGGEFFSVTIDGPSLVKPLYVAIFPDDEQPKDAKKGVPVTFTARWSRPKSGARPVDPSNGFSNAAKIPY